MEMYRHPGLPTARDEKRHLTRLYSAAKQGAVTSTPTHPDPNATAQSASLQRKYRIQKDRLIAWGLDWVDESKGSEGNIDESVAKAGLTETVASVLRNINEVTNEAERLLGGVLQTGGNKPLQQDIKSPIFDEARYEDLLQDLTASIDTLYDISRSRRAIARGEHPDQQDQETAKLQTTSAKITRKPLAKRPSFADSEITLVNPPSFHRPALSPYAGLPSRIEAASLLLPSERPPPYVSVGVPITTRSVGRLLRRRASETVQNTLASSQPEVPVLVEYATFDSTYRNTGVPPPLERLENIAAAFLPLRPDSQHQLSLLAYFEDPHQPRIGLVYDLPYSLQNKLQSPSAASMQLPQMYSLMNMMQKARDSSTSGQDLIPALEDRFKLALHLTQQLRLLHQQDFPHGNIGSDSIVFSSVHGESGTIKHKQLTSCHWTAFDVFSKSNVEGLKRSTSLNIYQHPEEDGYHRSMQLLDRIKFDLYGLGLVLLEVGQWATLSTLYKPKYQPTDFNAKIRNEYVPRLSARVGSTYMRVVRTCLEVAEEQIMTRKRIDDVYATVLDGLERCCALDPQTYTKPAEPVVVQQQVRPTFKFSGGTGEDLLKRIEFMENCSRDLAEARDWVLTYNHTADQADLDQAWKVFNTLQDSFHIHLSQPVLTAEHDVQKKQLTRHQSEPTSQTDFDLPQERKPDLLHRHSIPDRRKALSTNLSADTPLPKSPIDTSDFENPTQTTTQQHAAEAVHLLEEPYEMQWPSTKPQRREFHLDLTPEMIQEWNQVASPKLLKLCTKVMGGCTESSSIDLTSYGESADTARPTFLITCESTAKVRELKLAIKRHFKYDHEKYQVVVKRDKVRRCRGRSLRKQEARRSMAPLDYSSDARNPFYQEQPLCGASIGAYRDDEHLPPASFGGIVLVDGKPFGMSVHHMLEPEDAEEYEEEDTSDALSIVSYDDQAEFSDGESTVRPGDAFQGDSDEIDAPDVPLDDDTPGITPDGLDEISITQPAIDDAIDLDLHVDEDEDDDSDSGIDEDHLLSYKLGEVHASSGLKRSAFKGTEGGYHGIHQSLPQEIDWCLFALEPPRIHPFNVVKGGDRFRTDYEPVKHSSRGEKNDRRSLDCYPCSVKDAIDLANAKVHCLGRTSGLACGVVSGAMQLVKLQGRKTFSASWAVHGEFGAGGDSGAWVISNDDGAVCGHVLAERAGKTYICPMELLLKDIRETLGAEVVELPVAAGETAVRHSARHSTDATSAQKKRLSRLPKLQTHSGHVGGVALPVSLLPSPPLSPQRLSLDSDRHAYHSNHVGMVVAS